MSNKIYNIGLVEDDAAVRMMLPEILRCDDILKGYNMVFHGHGDLYTAHTAMHTPSTLANPKSTHPKPVYDFLISDGNLPGHERGKAVWKDFPQDGLELLASAVSTRAVRSSKHALLISGKIHDFEEKSRELGIPAICKPVEYDALVLAVKTGLDLRD
ncbi:MAG: hypothetical protein WCK90_04335 [archaeon]